MVQITEYGTARISDNYNPVIEKPIKSFLKELEYDVNKKTECIDNNQNYVVKYNAYVYDLGDDEYKIDTNDYIHKLSIRDTKEYYPVLKAKLDELAKISKKQLEDVKVISNIERDHLSSNNYNVNDMKIYLNYLKSFNKKSIITKVGFSSSILFAILNFGYTIFQAVHDTLGISFMLFFISIISTICWGTSSSFAKTFLIGKTISLKIKKVKKILAMKNKINIKVNKDVNKDTTNTNIYRTSIINYMNSIMEGTNKLNSSERRQKLFELRNILDEYLNRCNDLHHDSTKLTLNENERTLMIETLDKLTSLEMEIASIIRHDNENKQVLVDGNDLINKIDENLLATGCSKEEIKKDCKRKTLAI